MSNPLECKMYYKILKNKYNIDCDMNCDKKEARTKWRKLALQHHPDKGGDVETFQELNLIKTIIEGDCTSRYKIKSEDVEKEKSIDYNDKIKQAQQKFYDDFAQWRQEQEKKKEQRKHMSKDEIKKEREQEKKIREEIKREREAKKKEKKIREREAKKKEKKNDIETKKENDIKTELIPYKTLEQFGSKELPLQARQAAFPQIKDLCIIKSLCAYNKDLIRFEELAKKAIKKIAEPILEMLFDHCDKILRNKIKGRKDLAKIIINIYFFSN